MQLTCQTGKMQGTGADAGRDCHHDCHEQEHPCCLSNRHDNDIFQPETCKLPQSRLTWLYYEENAQCYAESRWKKGSEGEQEPNQYKDWLSGSFYFYRSCRGPFEADLLITTPYLIVPMLIACWSDVLMPWWRFLHIILLLNLRRV